MICPICANRAREIGRKVPEKADEWDRDARRATTIYRMAIQPSQAALARHMIQEHGWREYTGTLGASAQ